MMTLCYIYIHMFIFIHKCIYIHNSYYMVKLFKNLTFYNFQNNELLSIKIPFVNSICLECLSAKFCYLL